MLNFAAGLWLVMWAGFLIRYLWMVVQDKELEWSDIWPGLWALGNLILGGLLLWKGGVG